MTDDAVEVRGKLTALARAVGDPDEDLVIAGEGNISGRSADGVLLVSPSGARLRDAGDDSWVAVSPSSVMEALPRPMSDEEWLQVILGSRVDPDAPRPTVEVALHAVLSESAGAGYIVHAHPTAVLSLLCSHRADLLARIRLIPDHVVALGRADCVLPYVDPGQELAREAALAIRRHVDDWGEAPRMLLVENHGLFAMGATPQQALDRARMAVKMARVLLGMPAGVEPVGLTPRQIARIDGREDEGYRRRLLA
jgi:rhamnose utilization protein RhaD (predicted bifunctional aldolase and dehydrogenase)